MNSIIKFFLILGLVYMTQCKKQNSIPLEALAQNPNLPNEVVFTEVAKQVFGKQFKEIRISEENKNYEVLIEYGGKTALTFASRGSYEKELKLFTAYFAWKYFRLTEPRNLQNLTLSLVKPYYVYHEEIQKEVIEEVEVLRVKILKANIQKLPSYDKFDLKLDLKEIEPKQEFLNSLESITQIWKVELDEFKRIELK